MQIKSSVFYSKKTEFVAIMFFLLCITVLAAVFYKERVLFNDTVNCIMDMFKKDTLNVTTNRYVSIFSQVLPYAAFKSDASLRTIIFLYSLNLILIPVGLSLLSMVWFGETKTTWSILLFYTIMSNRLFYYPISEFQGGLCFLLFYIGFTEYILSKNGIKNRMFWILSIIFIPTIVFSHPLSILVVAGWLIFRLSVNRNFFIPLTIIGLLSISSRFIKKIFFSSIYDDTKSKNAENLLSFKMEYLDQRLANQFYEAIREDYFLVPFLIILAIAALIKLKKYLGAVVFTLVILSFWVLITVTFKDDLYWYYSEHMYQPVTFFIALVSGRYLIEAYKPAFYLPVLILTLLVSVNKVFYGYEPMRKRLEWYNNCFTLMESKGIKKAIIGTDRIDIGWDMGANWLTMYESLVFSALDGPEKAKTITVVWNEDESRTAANQGTGFVFVHLDHWPISDIPSQYFQLGSSHYTILSDVFPHNLLLNMSYDK